MEVDPREILDHFGDRDYLKKLIADSEKMPSRADANEILTATLVYLAENIRVSGEASERHAKSLKRATWMLFVATLALVGVAVLQLLQAAIW